MADDWAGAVQTQISGYVTQETWSRLFRSQGRHCRALALLAQHILQVRQQVVGAVSGWLPKAMGVASAAAEFASELAANIPIPVLDVKLIAVARDVQVTGILLCVIRGDDLTQCQCFRDLALAETKTCVKAILNAVTGDWVRLAEFPPPEMSPAA